MCIHHMLSQLMPGIVVACKLEEVQLAELMTYHSHTHTTWTTIDYIHVGRVIALFNPKTSISTQKRHPYTGNLSSERLRDSENAFLHWAYLFEYLCADTRV